MCLNIVRLVKVGDVIFADIYAPEYGQYIDGTMDHVFVVTKIQTWRSGYHEIRVSANTKDYLNESLGSINAKYNQQIEFHVYRPVAYVEK